MQRQITDNGSLTCNHLTAGTDRCTIRHTAVGDVHSATGIDRCTVRHTAVGDVHKATGIDRGTVRHTAAVDVHGAVIDRCVLRDCIRMNRHPPIQFQIGNSIGFKDNIRTFCCRNISAVFFYIQCRTAAGKVLNLSICSAQASDSSTLAPGQSSAANGIITVGCGNGTALEIRDLIPAGGKRMTAGAFCNGLRGEVPEFITDLEI